MNDEFATKKEFWYFIGMVAGLGLSIMLGLWAAISIVLCEDLVGRIEKQQNTIISQEETIKDFSYDAAQYKILYEEIYELHQNCVETGGDCQCQTEIVKP